MGQAFLGWAFSQRATAGWLGAGALSVVIGSCTGNSTGLASATGGAGSGGRPDHSSAGTATAGEVGQTGGRGQDVCDPGATQSCVGPGGCKGAQVCRDDSSGWGACDCGGGVGGADGTAGANGIGGGSGGRDGGDAGRTSTGGTGGAPATAGAAGLPADGGTSAGGGGGAVPGTGGAQGGGGERATGGSATGGASGTGGVIDTTLLCEVQGDRLLVPVTYRDFDADHIDMEPGASGYEDATPDLVLPALGADGLPVLADDATGGFIDGAESFDQWYRDDATVNATVTGQIVLFDDGKGGYVNRWGASGEPWLGYENIDFCGYGGSDCEYCDPDVPCFDPCPELYDTYECTADVVEYDGTPLFFPLDDHPDALTPPSDYELAGIPEQYGGIWDSEDGITTHNFHFTSELRIWPTYDSARSVTVDIQGDDDVWVFVNGMRAIDLGGVHTPVEGTFTLSADNAADYGIAGGSTYEIAVFHAERQTTGSTMRLRFTGFDWTTTSCVAP